MSLSPQERIQVGNGALSISRLTLTDTGMYQCVAGNKHGEVYSNAELRVIGKTPALCVSCVWVCVSHSMACIQYFGMDTWAQAFICSYLFSSVPRLPPLLNTGGWPPASPLLAANWKALIIRWMGLADSDVCQGCSVHQPRPSALSSLSLSTPSWQQLSFTIHPPVCLILIM